MKNDQLYDLNGWDWKILNYLIHFIIEYFRANEVEQKLPLWVL